MFMSLSIKHVSGNSVSDYETNYSYERTVLAAFAANLLFVLCCCTLQSKGDLLKHSLIHDIMFGTLNVEKISSIVDGNQ
jgi:hypothetical protein